MAEKGTDGMFGVDHAHWRFQLEQESKSQVCTDVPLAGN
jgi:hypothetical protein